MCNKQKNFSWLWKGGRNFLVEKIVFFENKKFLSQGVCKIKFLFLGGWWGNVLAIMCNKQKNFSLVWKRARIFLVSKLGFWRHKTLITLRSSKLKFLCLQHVVGHWICSRTSGWSPTIRRDPSALEFFYCSDYGKMDVPMRILGNFWFLESKKFIAGFQCKIKIWFFQAC